METTLDIAKRVGPEINADKSEYLILQTKELPVFIKIGFKQSCVNITLHIQLFDVISV